MNKKPKIIRPFIVTKDGIKKYNVTMLQAKKPIEKWIEDAQEEAWDQIVYLEKIKSLLTKLN